MRKGKRLEGIWRFFKFVPERFQRLNSRGFAVLLRDQKRALTRKFYFITHFTYAFYRTYVHDGRQ